MLYLEFIVCTSSTWNLTNSPVSLSISICVCVCIRVHNGFSFSFSVRVRVCVALVRLLRVWRPWLESQPQLEETRKASFESRQVYQGSQGSIPSRENCTYLP